MSGGVVWVAGTRIADFATLFNDVFANQRTDNAKYTSSNRLEEIYWRERMALDLLVYDVRVRQSKSYSYVAEIHTRTLHNTMFSIPLVFMS